MLDHVSLPVADLARATAFYDAVLAELRLERTRQLDGAVGYGNAGRAAPRFWLLERRDASGARAGVGLHVSFEATTRAAVDAFFETALRCGGRDAGRPGPRPEYTAPFYGAFVLDPDGFKVEAVCRSGEVHPDRQELLASYFGAMRAHDWDRLAECLSPEVHRTGPYRDEVRGREAYVEFLAGIVPTLPGYLLRVARVRSVGDASALVELSETVDLPDGRTEYPEALVFDFDAEGRIEKVDVYIMRPPTDGSS